MVKKEFLAIFKSATEEFEKYFESKIKPSLKDLSIIEKVKFLKVEDEKLKAISDGVEFRAYEGVSTDEDSLLKVYTSRRTILDADDSVDLKNAVYAGGLHALIRNELINLKKDIPLYYYKDFIEGKRDIFSEELNYFLHFEDREDLNKIREWQADKINLMVSIETKVLVNAYQSKLQSELIPLDVIKKDLEYYQGNIKNTKFESSEELIKEFKNLSFLNDYHFNLINNPESLDSYNLFVDSELDWSKINPPYIKETRDRYHEDKTKLFSASPVVFYTIFQVTEWMIEVVEGKDLFEPFKFPDFLVIVTNILETEHSDAVKMVQNFKKEKNFNQLSSEEQERILVQALNQNRIVFNEFEDDEKQYYASIYREVTDKVFLLNALFFDLDYHETSLKKAAKAYYEFFYLMGALSVVSSSPKINLSNNQGSFNPHQVFSLAYAMVLDNDLHKQLRKIYDGALSDLLQYNLHIDFVIQNLSEQLHDLFLACIERLRSYLDDCEPSNKVMFIQSKLKDLRLRDLMSKPFVVSDDMEQGESYASLLKEYLEIEAEFIKETKDISFYQQATPIKQIRVPNSKKPSEDNEFSFGFKENDPSVLKSFVLELNRQIYLLKDGGEVVDDFVNVLTSGNLNEELPKIIFNCETTQLYYIFNHLKPYFNNLTFSHIEKSQLFFTKNGNLLKAQNLSASKIEYPKNYKEIDQAFTLLH